MEARGFRDAYDQFKKRGAAVFGISADSPKAQKKFSEANEIPFPMLCDTEKKAISAFGAWKQGPSFGINALGIQRSTFVISPEGKIAKVFPKVKPEGHAQEVLAALGKT